MSHLELPPFILKEREGLREEIYEAFANVSRIGGVSWSEARVIDSDYLVDGSPEFDSRWEDLVNDHKWNPESGVGGFPFLDSIGTKYYLPAALVRALDNIWVERLEMALMPEGRIAKSNDFDNRQRTCIKRFVQYMSVVTSFLTAGSITWYSALEFWNQVE